MRTSLLTRHIAVLALLAAGLAGSSRLVTAGASQDLGNGARSHRACALPTKHGVAACDALVVDLLPGGIVPNAHRPTPTNTVRVSPSSTRTFTPTRTNTATPTNTPTVTNTPDVSPTPSSTPGACTIPTATPPPNAPSGYGPAALDAAYCLPSATAGNGQTVAIVDAFDDPNAEADLAMYRGEFGLTPCTSQNGCFKKVNQTGGTTYPAGDSGWAEEISLDLDMVSAICPNCHILLVEANDNSFTNLGAAVDEAAKLGANAISNSYGGGEYSGETIDESHFNHPGVAITVSSGDSGYGVEFPASSQYVTAVGGTSLSRAAGARGWSETAWSGAGSGCSAYEPQPSWQSTVANITGSTGGQANCHNRAVADVSAVADPSTGVAVYDTYGTGATWLVFGGTSVASPIIASVYALAGNAASVSFGSYPYSHAGSLNDVTGGSNGSCGGTDLCTAVPGYDGPTGLGSPNGTGGF